MGVSQAVGLCAWPYTSSCACCFVWHLSAQFIVSQAGVGCVAWMCAALLLGCLGRCFSQFSTSCKEMLMNPPYTCKRHEELGVKVPRKISKRTTRSMATHTDLQPAGPCLSTCFPTKKIRAREVAKGNREGRSKEAARRAKGQRIERARRPDRPERPERRKGTRGPEGKQNTTTQAPALQQQAYPTNT